MNLFDGALLNECARFEDDDPIGILLLVESGRLIDQRRADDAECAVKLISEGIGFPGACSLQKTLGEKDCGTEDLDLCELDTASLGSRESIATMLGDRAQSPLFLRKLDLPPSVVEVITFFLPGRRDQHVTGRPSRGECAVARQAQQRTTRSLDVVDLSRADSNDAMPRPQIACDEVEKRRLSTPSRSRQNGVRLLGKEETELMKKKL